MGNIGMTDVAKRNGGIFQAHDELADAVAKLNNAAEELEMRLQPALLPENPVGCEKDCAPEPTRCEIGRALMLRANEVRRVTARLGDIRNRLEM